MNADENSPGSLFVDLLGMDEHSATLLANEGLTSIEELAYVPLSELAEIKGVSQAFISRFRELARQYLDRGLDGLAGPSAKGT